MQWQTTLLKDCMTGREAGSCGAAICVLLLKQLFSRCFLKGLFLLLIEQQGVLWFEHSVPARWSGNWALRCNLIAALCASKMKIILTDVWFAISIVCQWDEDDTDMGGLLSVLCASELKAILILVVCCHCCVPVRWRRYWHGWFAVSVACQWDEGDTDMGGLLSPLCASEILTWVVFFQCGVPVNWRWYWWTGKRGERWWRNCWRCSTPSHPQKFARFALVGWHLWTPLH